MSDDVMIVCLVTDVHVTQPANAGRERVTQTEENFISPEYAMSQSFVRLTYLR